MRLASASTLPIVLDSTEPPVIEAGLERLAGRCLVNSVNYEDGDGPELAVGADHAAHPRARRRRGRADASTRRARPAPPTGRSRSRRRLIEDLTGNSGMRVDDIVVDCLTFPVTTGQEETRRDALETIEAIRELKRRYPAVQTTLGVSNVSFGVNPAARSVLNSVFLHECVEAGLDSAIVHAARIMPLSRIPEEQLEVALDLVYDRRREGYDPLQRLLEIFADVTHGRQQGRARRGAGRACRWPSGCSAASSTASATGSPTTSTRALGEGRPALEIVNQDLLAGMKEVGELFGSGQMQLPFVLQSAEVMKAAVAHLEPHMEATDEQGKGTIVLATVKGDVHDIGKNLVDIILTNNGYTVVNLGIKQPVSAILDAAQEHDVDVIGMSGLLVKSTVVMRENLEELNSRELAGRWPVILGGAALTRGLRRGGPGRAVQGRGALRPRRVRGAAADGRAGGVQARRAGRRAARAAHPPGTSAAARPRSSRSTCRRAPTSPPTTRCPSRRSGAPGWSRASALPDVAEWLDERATFMGQWGLRGARGGDGPSYEELVETEGRPRLRMWLERVQTEQIMEPAVVYGYWPCWSEGDDLVVLDPDDTGHRDRAVHVPAPAPRPVPLPGRLLPAQGVRRARRHRPAPGDHGQRGSAR